MKSLNLIGTSAFSKCTINEFDVPNLNKIIAEIEDYSKESITYSVGKKNF